MARSIAATAESRLPDWLFWSAAETRAPTAGDDDTNATGSNGCIISVGSGKGAAGAWIEGTAEPGIASVPGAVSIGVVSMGSIGVVVIGPESLSGWVSTVGAAERLACLAFLGGFGLGAGLA